MKTIPGFLIFLMICSCSPDPIPQDQMVYVGVWQGSNIFLEIDANGNASYAKLRDGAVIETVDSPVKKIGDGKIVIGYLFITKTLELTKPPFEEDGNWKMIIDGVTLIKQTTL
jgi:hypothetical protein